MVKRRHAVLIADVVGSRTRRNLRALLGERLEKASRAQLRGRLIRLPYAITAGDEFQTIAWSCERLPELIFDLRATMWPLGAVQRTLTGYDRSPAAAWTVTGLR